MDVYVLFDAGDYYGPYYDSTHATLEAAQRHVTERELKENPRRRKPIGWREIAPGTWEPVPEKRTQLRVHWEIKREVVHE